MFSEHVNVLADCCKNTLDKMTNASIKDVKVKQNQEQSKVFSVAHVIPYEDNEQKIKGDFMLGFADESTALFVASAITGKMGLPPLKRFDDMASDSLGEFMNTVVGNAISVWDNMDFSVKFGHPVMERDKNLESTACSSCESYQIIMDIGSDNGTLDNVVFIITFVAAPDNSLECKRILVVDDSALVRQFLSVPLADLGAEVEVAKNGLEAVEKHKTFKPHLTIMDLVMPEMGGFDAIVKIRETEPDANFIMSTSSAKKEEIITAATLKVKDYVVKPMEIKDFIAKVKKVFE